MSTKKTLPTMSEEEVAKRLRERANPSFAGAITVEWMKIAANTIDSLRNRLDAAEKELAELKGALDFGVKCNDDLQVELTKAKEANAELVKDGVHVFLDDRAVPILMSAIQSYSRKLDLNSPRGGYENAFCLDLIAHLNAAIEAIDAAAAKGTQ